MSPSPSTTVDAHRSGFSGATHRACHGTAGVAFPIVDRPIGMFDSGFGGLTVARALIDLLPSEDSSTSATPGATRTGRSRLHEVRRYANELAWSLVKDLGVKAVVVACNTATAAGLDELRDELPVPVIDVIEPGARALVTATISGRVGVIGTVGTISSGAYHRAIARTGAPVSLTSAACPGFVEFVERGQTAGDEVTVLAERLLAPISRREGRRAAARVHALPVPRPSDQRCDGARGHARQFGRRDRLRGPRDARVDSGCCATTCGPASIASCRAATSTGSASSAAACSAPSSTTPNPGHSQAIAER